MIIPLGDVTAPKGFIVAPHSTEMEVILQANTGSLPLMVHSYTGQEGQNINQVTPIDEIIPTGVRAELSKYFLMVR